jgi:hypothetical protein
MKIRVGNTKPGTEGHICSGARVDLYDEDGDIVGYLVPHIADKARRGRVVFEKEDS